MPRNVSGNYSLPLPPVVPGELIESGWANDTLDDIGIALTDSLDRHGRGGMLAAFKFFDGTEASPGAAWADAPGTGFWRDTSGLNTSINGVGITLVTSNGFEMYPGMELFTMTDPTTPNSVPNAGWIANNFVGYAPAAPIQAIDSNLEVFTIFTKNYDGTAPALSMGRSGTSSGDPPVIGYNIDFSPNDGTMLRVLNDEASRIAFGDTYFEGIFSPVAAAGTDLVTGQTVAWLSQSTLFTMYTGLELSGNILCFGAISANSNITSNLTLFGAATQAQTHKVGPTSDLDPPFWYQSAPGTINWRVGLNPTYRFGVIQSDGVFYNQGGKIRADHNPSATNAYEFAFMAYGSYGGGFGCVDSGTGAHGGVFLRSDQAVWYNHGSGGYAEAVLYNSGGYSLLQIGGRLYSTDGSNSAYVANYSASGWGRSCLIGTIGGSSFVFGMDGSGNTNLLINSIDALGFDGAGNMYHRGKGPVQFVSRGTGVTGTTAPGVHDIAYGLNYASPPSVIATTTLGGPYTMSVTIINTNGARIEARDPSFALVNVNFTWVAVGPI